MSNFLVTTFLKLSMILKLSVLTAFRVHWLGNCCIVFLFILLIFEIWKTFLFTFSLCLGLFLVVYMAKISMFKFEWIMFTACDQQKSMRFPVIYDTCLRCSNSQLETRFDCFYILAMIYIKFYYLIIVYIFFLHKGEMCSAENVDKLK